MLGAATLFLTRPTRCAPRDPHWVLLAGGAIVLVCEGLRGSSPILTSPIWPLIQASVAACALVIAWRHQERLRLPLILALTAAFQVGWLGLHVLRGVNYPVDSGGVYPVEGKALLDGHYPASEYPPGAVLLFAFDVLLAGGRASGVRVSHALVMVPFQLAIVAGIWALRTPRAAWFAAAAALWPLDAFYWEFEYDLAPAAALVLGLLAAFRGRWALAGAVLGIGAALKWTPGLAALGIVVWLISSGWIRRALGCALSFICAFAVVNLPFLLLWPSEFFASYRLQGGRGITAESFWYLPLRVLGLVEAQAVYAPAAVPSWAGPLAIGVQLAAVASLFAALVRFRGERIAAIATAAVAPGVFLLTNRVFSPQFVVLLVAAWAVAGALVARGARDVVTLAALVAGATTANVVVYPVQAPHLFVISGVFFLLAIGATLWVVRGAAQLGAR